MLNRRLSSSSKNLAGQFFSSFLGLHIVPLDVDAPRQFVAGACPTSPSARRRGAFTTSSGSAIRDGMLAGDIQVGSGGVGPFLVGYSAGVDWKLLSALNEMDLWLMVVDEQIQDLGDFGDGSTDTRPAPSHAYASAGDYTVTLTVMDSHGESRQTFQSVTVRARPRIASLSAR